MTPNKGGRPLKYRLDLLPVGGVKVLDAGTLFTTARRMALYHSKRNGTKLIAQKDGDLIVIRRAE